MVCPKCGGNTTVFDNSFNPEVNEYYRKRTCLTCDHKFFTIEFEVEPTEQFQKDWLKHHRFTRTNVKRKEDRRKRKEDMRKRCEGCENYDYIGGPHCEDCEVMIDRRQTASKLFNKE